MNPCTAARAAVFGRWLCKGSWPGGRIKDAKPGNQRLTGLYRRVCAAPVRTDWFALLGSIRDETVGHTTHAHPLTRLRETHYYSKKALFGQTLAPRRLALGGY